MKLQHQMTTPLVALLYPHKHRTYVEDHDMDEGAKTTRKKRGPNDVDMLMVRPLARERMRKRGCEGGFIREGGS